MSDNNLESLFRQVELGKCLACLTLQRKTQENYGENVVDETTADLNYRIKICPARPGKHSSSTKNNSLADDPRCANSRKDMRYEYREYCFDLE
jgi:hypothetical protein